MRGRTGSDQALRFDCVDIVVEDLDQALRFYVDTLGLSQVGRVRESERNLNLKWVYVGSGEQPVVALLQPTGAGPLLNYLEANGPGVLQLSFVTSDLDEMAVRLKAHGARRVARR